MLYSYVKDPVPDENNDDAVANLLNAVFIKNIEARFNKLEDYNKVIDFKIKVI